MKRFIIAFAILLGLLFILTQCARNSGNPVGDDYFQREYEGDQKYAVFYPSPSDTFYQTFVNSGISPYLYVGQSTDIESQILIRFSELPDSGTVLEKAILTLHAHRIFGEQTGTFMASVSEITDEWVEKEVTWESFETGGLKGTQFMTRKISADEISAWNDTLSLKFILPNNIVQSWINDPSDSSHHGICLSLSTPSSFIAEFYSNNEPYLEDNRPKLTLYSIEDTSAVNSIVHISPDKDCTVSKTNRGPSADFLHIGNGTALRTMLFFNLDSIPMDATINRALLTMHADTTRSFPNHNENFTIYAHHATQIPWPFPEVPYDSTQEVSGSMNGDSTWMQINTSSLLQSWTFGFAENQGFLLKGSHEKDDLLERVFHSTNTADTLLRPYLEVFYTLPPKSRL